MKGFTKNWLQKDEDESSPSAVDKLVLPFEKQTTQAEQHGVPASDECAHCISYQVCPRSACTCGGSEGGKVSDKVTAF